MDTREQLVEDLVARGMISVHAAAAVASAILWIGPDIRYYWESPRVAFLWGGGRSGGLCLSPDGETATLHT